MSKIYMGVIVPCTVVLPILMALYRRAYWNAPARIMLLFLLLSAVFNIIAKVTAHSNNLPYLHLYSILEFGVLCAFFRSIVNKAAIRKVYTLVGLVFPVISMVYLLAAGSLYQFNHVARFISSVGITMMCLYFLLKDIGSIQSGYSMFLFVAIIGLLLYYSTCSTLFILSNELMHIPEQRATMIWNIHATFNLLLYLHLFVAYFHLKKAHE